jgi:hypothetical protein
MQGEKHKAKTGYYSGNVAGGFLNIYFRDNNAARSWSWGYSRHDIPCGGLVFAESLHTPGWWPTPEEAHIHAMQVIAENKWGILGYRVLDDEANTVFAAATFEEMVEFLRQNPGDYRFYCGFSPEERVKLNLKD